METSKKKQLRLLKILIVILILMGVTYIMGWIAQGQLRAFGV